MDEFIAYIDSNPFEGFEDWLGELSSEVISGFAGECWAWINAWGSGGGNYYTEERAKEAIEEIGTGSPRELADAVYHAISDYTESPLEASCIVKLMIEESLVELRKAL